MKNFLFNHWLKLLAIAMLLGALTNYFPFVYYQLMNWVTVIASITIAWQSHKQNNLWMMWLFILVAVVFNPLQPLYIQQEIWRILDVIVAALIALSIVLLKDTSEQN